MRLEASRLWRLVGRDAQQCWRMRARKGVWMRPEALMRRRSCAVVRRKRTCHWLREAQGANVRSWAALPQSRRLGCMSSCAHVRSHRRGGARMGAVRSRISMTIIGAPQCRQRKTAGTAGPGSSGWAPASGTTPSRSRTLARLTRRTGLASSP